MWQLFRNHRTSYTKPFLLSRGMELTPVSPSQPFTRAYVLQKTENHSKVSVRVSWTAAH